TADDGSFDVTIPGGASATFTAPSEAGTYGFFCKFHGNMKGSLTVGAEGMAQMHEKMMLDHPEMAQMHDQMMLDYPEMAQMHEKMMMGGAGMAQMHEKMMADHPDMARMHDQMMADHPDMARMHDQMMMGGAESGSAEGNGMDQMGAVPKGGADTGVSTESTSEESITIALGGGLLLLAAASGTYVVYRRNSSN
ncbi:cupredoxin domain-containing protein, partial [Arthrobacter sp. Br18]|uniref:cupredoxin domain-containing protein n=1 Tax=Arthrobacter sp. Br18 TaxID=1312954 RepID=UPI00056B0A46